MKRPGRIAWFFLARELGMSVARAQSEIGSMEFSEWLAFQRITYHPDDKRMAMICCMIARANGAKNVKPQHFMPAIKKRPQTSAEMKRILMALSPPQEGQYGN